MGTGQQLYGMYAYTMIVEANTSVDPWDEVDDATKQVWNALAKNIKFELTDAWKVRLGV